MTRSRANGEGSIFPYRNGYAAYAWVTNPAGRAQRTRLRKDTGDRPRQVDQAAATRQAGSGRNVGADRQRVHELLARRRGQAERRTADLQDLRDAEPAAHHPRDRTPTESTGSASSTSSASSTAFSRRASAANKARTSAGRRTSNDAARSANAAIRPSAGARSKTSGRYFARPCPGQSPRNSSVATSRATSSSRVAGPVSVAAGQQMRRGSSWRLPPNATTRCA
jgi:hypothetical protein